MQRIYRTTVDTKIQNGYNFEFGKYLSDGFNLFGKEFGQFILFAFVSCIIMVFSAITIIGPTVVFICTLNGFAEASGKIEQGQKVEFNDFFRGYDKFGSKIVLALIYFGFTLLLYVPLIVSLVSMGYFSGNLDENAAAPLTIGFMLFSYAIFYGGILILHSALLFSSYLIHFGDYSAGEAVSKSFQLYRKNFIITTIFVLVLLILAYIGLGFCLIGFFASFPIMGLGFYSLVKETLISGEYSEIEEIGSTSF